jgi:NADPH-dependent F420 reductase
MSPNSRLKLVACKSPHLRCLGRNAVLVLQYASESDANSKTLLRWPRQILSSSAATSEYQLKQIMANQRIAIIGGTGDQGKGLALRWARAGFEVIIGSRDAARAMAVAEAMPAAIDDGSGGNAAIRGAVNAEAAGSAPIVVLTVPFAAQIGTLKEIRDRLAPGTLLVDVTVPLEAAVGGRPSRMLGVWAGSAAEQCAELAPPGVEVVSAFHNVAADLLADLAHEVECDVLVCGDSKEAKARVRPLVEAIAGCRFIDGGPLANSRTVEAVTALLIGLNIRYKAHTGIRITGLKP